ncbi:MAG: inorganic phosphate transporter [Opitutaceae bacterium]|nr:inorganic phosphate transporter [Opitutaceae bacterium]
MTIFLIVLVTALVFEYINGFHDAANAIATVVSTKVLTPRQAIALAAIFNLIGALMGTAVASTIGKGLVDTEVVTMVTIFSGLMGAIIWNLITWWLGLPSSSSHALIGGLCGAAVASANGDWNVLHWATTDAKGAAAGLWPKVVLPMFTSPLIGFFGGAFLMFLLTIFIHRLTPRVVNGVFGKLQLVSAGLMAHSHGSNDAQKTMGIIALALFTGTNSGAFDNLPAWAAFLHTPEFKVDRWLIITCAIVMAAGTAAGGWRIIRTMGHKMVRLQPVHGFAAETTAAVIIHVASTLGIPLSTTHAISTSIMGVGAVKRFGAVKWGVVERILWAWVFTLPVCGLIGYATEKVCKYFGYQ